MNLNIIPNGAIKRVHVSQNDVGRTLTFELFNNSTSYTVPIGATVKIQGTKPSGFGFSETCTVNGNVVTVDTTETMTDEHGYIDTELSISYSGNKIGTSNFILAVEKNPHPDTTTDGSMETIIPELTLLVNEVKGYAEEIEGTYHAYGSPWVASTVAQMTDTDKIYVYTGSETGYVNGNWYYYNGTAWVSGGVYNAVAVQTDTTLSVSGMPADAKVVGDEIDESDNRLYNLAFEGVSEFAPKWQAGEYNSAGNLVSSNAYFCTGKFNIADIKGVVANAPASQNLYIYRWFLDGTFDRYITLLKGTSVTISYDTSVYGMVAFETTKTQWENVSFGGIRKVALLSDLDAEFAIPDYYTSHMATKITGIESRLFSSENTDAFVFVTDVHLPNNNMVSPKLINNIFENTPVDKMICGGDIPGLYGDSNTVLSVAKQYYDTFYKACVRNHRKHYMVRGNHDWTVRTSSGSTTGFTAPEAEVYSLSTRLQQDYVNIPNLRNYYSFENTTQKIKYIVLDTNEILKSNDDTVAFNYAYGCHQEQVTWFINELLNVNSDYAVMVIGHVPVDVTLSSEGTRNMQIMSDIMKAYKNKRVFDGSIDPSTNTPYRIYYDEAVQETLSGNADFTETNGDLVAYICGHEHKDAHSTIDGVNYIVVGPDALYADDPNVTRDSGTVTESLFDVCVINKTTKYIHCIRVGAGTSFSLSY